MANTKLEDTIFLDDVIDLSKFKGVYIYPLAGLYVKEEDINEIYRKLKEYQEKHGKFEVFYKKDIPSRFNYKNNDRIPDILMIPEKVILFLKLGCCNWR